MRWFSMRCSSTIDTDREHLELYVKTTDAHVNGWGFRFLPPDLASYIEGAGVVRCRSIPPKKDAYARPSFDTHKTLDLAISTFLNL